uniref:Uncharacterized protein n=1 Tax=Timema monikensis TaxID=170555 RepID=A0A7R9HU30_9NEOP|nr:unnamed protein product [Timema monikensis]
MNWGTDQMPDSSNQPSITHLSPINNQLSMGGLSALQLNRGIANSRGYVSECKHLPHSYSHQTNKEKLILWYAENCRRQFHFLHPDRRPQFLAADNECGIQVLECP